MKNFIFDYNHLITPDLGNEAYCDIRRVLFNIILNSSENVFRENGDPHPVRMNRTDVSLLLIFELLHEIYPIRKIGREIATTFLYHSKDWVSLLSVQNKIINNSNDFKVECSKYIYLLELSNKNDLDVTDKTSKADIEEYLSNIRVKITPAGICYSTHICQHFEFFSAIIHPDQRSAF